MRIGPVEIGSGHPCRVVAEISNAHNGDRDRCGRLIDAAKAAGADLVKFQAYSPDELVALRGDGPAPEPWGGKGWTMRALYEKARTPFEWFPKIAAHCERIGMPWFSSVFGPESLVLLEGLGCPAYKIAALDNHQHRLLDSVAATGKPIVVSALRDNDVRWPPSRLPRQSVLLYCPAGYPAHDVRMPLFLSLECGIAGETSWLEGVSLHSKDADAVAVAVARGAKLIEVHFHLRSEPSELEANVSWDELELAAMIDRVRRTEEVLG